jgi:hypothetical protein
MLKGTLLRFDKKTRARQIGMRAQIRNKKITPTDTFLFRSEMKSRRLRKAAQILEIRHARKPKKEFPELVPRLSEL